MKAIKKAMTMVSAGWFFLLLVIASTSFAKASDLQWKSNNSWITINGTVGTVKPDSFQLQYGDGAVTVEMDDGDRNSDGYKLVKGDKVTVTGRVDHDLFEKKKIEAGAVFVENIGTTFYASPLDEEDSKFYYSYTTYYPVSVGTGHLHGTVAEVGTKEFTIDNGLNKVTVGVENMPYNPLDKEGYLRLKKGDRVSITGKMTGSFLTGRKFKADSIVAYSSTKNESDSKAE